MSIDETALPRGVHRLPEPCWTVLTHDGRPAGFEESEPHYLSQAEAFKAAPDYWPDGEPPGTVVQMSDRCWVAYLHCGQQYVCERADDAVHFADEDDLRGSLALDGLALVDAQDGVFACDSVCVLCGPYQLAAHPGRFADTLSELADLILRFGTVERITLHPDRVTRETDTTHTVMLGIVACAIAERFYPKLDLGRIAQRSLVHDLEEVHAGDTPTLRALTVEQKQDKAERERQAGIKIYVDLGHMFPWISRTIALYKGRTTVEDRFVWAVDKLLPKFTHLLNGAAVVAADGMTRAELAGRYEQQRTELGPHCAEFPELLDLHRELAGRVLDLVGVG